MVPRSECPWTPLIERLEAVMRARGPKYGPADLARDSEIALTTLSGTLNCEHRPSVGTLEKLARQMGVHLSELKALSGYGESVSDAELDKLLDSPDLELHMLLKQAGRELSPEARESLKPYLRYVLESDRQREAEEKRKRGNKS